MDKQFEIKSRSYGRVKFVWGDEVGAARLYMDGRSCGVAFYCPDNPRVSKNFARQCRSWWRKFLRQQR